MKLITRSDRWTLKRLIASMGLKHADVAKAMGMNQSQFSGMLNGSRLARETFTDEVRTAVRDLTANGAKP